MSGSIYKGILQQIVYQSSGQRLVHLHLQIALRHREIHFYLLVLVYLREYLHALVDYLRNAYKGLLRELSVVYLRKHEQGTVEPHHRAQSALYAHQFLHLLPGKLRIVYKPLHPVADNRQRSLKLVRGIAYKLLLRLESLLVTVEGLLGCLVEFPELSDVSRVVQRRIAAAYPEPVKPAQQLVERPHVAVENQHGDQHDRQKQKDIQGHYPHQCGAHQFLLVDSRSIDLQQIILPVIHHEDCCQHAGRLISYQGEILLAVVVAYLRIIPCELLPYRNDIVHDVGALIGRQLIARERPFYDKLGKQVQRVIRLVIDIVHHLEIEKRGPCGHQGQQNQGKPESYAVNELHPSCC